MSGIIPTSQVGWFRTFIRGSVSPNLTSLYACLGFTHRDLLRDKIRTSGAGDQQLLLDRLASQGILKSRFRETITDVNQVESFMLHGRTTAEKLESFDALSGITLSDSTLYADRIAFLSTVTTAITTGAESVYHSFSSPDCRGYQWTLAIAKATMTAATLATVLVGLPWFMGGAPNISARGAILGGLTGLGIISALEGDRLPPHSMLRSVAKFIATKILPLSIIGCGAHLIADVHSSNMRISSIFESIGLEGTTAYVVGAMLLVRKFVTNNLTKFRQAYTGMLDPGSFRGMNRLVKGAGLSIIAEAHFLAAFAILVGASATFLFPAVWAVTPLALIPFAIPVVATGVHIGLRCSTKANKELPTAKQTKFLDHLKIYLPFEGIFAGYAASFAFSPATWLTLIPFALSALGFGLNAALTYSPNFTTRFKQLISRDPKKQDKIVNHLRENVAIESVVVTALASLYAIAFWPSILPIAYLTFFGSLATLLVSQDHGIFHSINTNKDELALLRCSGHDLLGRHQVRSLVGGKTVMLLNPYTGLIEHSTGFLFNLLLARKPHLPIFCMHDKIPSQLGFKDTDLLDPTIKAELIRRAIVVINSLDNPREFEDFCVWIEANKTRIKAFPNAKAVADWAYGLLPNLRDFTEDRHYIAYATGLQRTVHEMIDAGVAAERTIQGRYRRLIANLHRTANYYEADLSLELQRSFKGWISVDELGSQGPQIWTALTAAGLITEVREGVAQLQKGCSGHTRTSFASVAGIPAGEHNRVFDLLQQRVRERRWFEMWNGKENWFVEEIGEYQRAGMEDLLSRAEDFRETARRLQTKLDRGETSEADLQREWAWETGCFDPDTTNAPAVGRKELAGDEWKVRKVENVATGILMRGMTVYKLWYEESPVMPTTDWVRGTWTRIYNPRFLKGAAPGSLAAAKYIWIEADTVLTEFQRERSEFLSTSPVVLSVDNMPDPSRENNFTAGSEPIPDVEINGERQTITNYFYVTDNNQLASPSIKNFNWRPGQTTLPVKYKFAPRDKPDNLAMTPLVFTVPLFDHVVMVDKNDIEVDTYTVLPAIISRDSGHLQMNFIYRQPFGSPVEFADPHPTKELDTEIGLQLYDDNIELSYNGRVIPMLLDRAAAHVGRDESVDWKQLRSAKVSMHGGHVTAFSLLYGAANREVRLPESTYPRFINCLELPDGDNIPIRANNFTAHPQREGDRTWVKIPYRDGTIAFVRLPDTMRPAWFNKDREII